MPIFVLCKLYAQPWIIKYYEMKTIRDDLSINKMKLSIKYIL